MRRRAMALALVFAGAAACSYIVDLPSSYVSIPSPDASSDGPTESATSPLDAAIPFCESRTTPSLFCADFDDNPAPDLTALGTVQTAGGSLQLANAISLSPPRSLLSAVNIPDASSMLIHPLGASPERITASSSFLISAWGGAEARLTRIELTPSDAGAGALCFVQLTAGATWLVTQVCSGNGVEVANTSANSNQPVETRKWQRFSLSLTLTPPKTVTLDIDDVRVVNVPALDAMQPSPMSVAFGVERSASGTLVLFQDNVLVTSP